MSTKASELLITGFLLFICVHCSPIDRVGNDVNYDRLSFKFLDDRSTCECSYLQTFQPQTTSIDSLECLKLLNGQRDIEITRILFQNERKTVLERSENRALDTVEYNYARCRNKNPDLIWGSTLDIFYPDSKDPIMYEDMMEIEVHFSIMAQVNAMLPDSQIYIPKSRNIQPGLSVIRFHYQENRLEYRIVRIGHDSTSIESIVIGLLELIGSPNTIEPVIFDSMDVYVRYYTQDALVPFK